MNLELIASAYVNCVDLEERAHAESPPLSEDLANLRADLHALWMRSLQEAGIAFTDRSDAARMAYEFVRKQRKVASQSGF